MKKQIGLVALIALLITFMAFSGVASAQANNKTAYFFTSPFCASCKEKAGFITAAADKHGVKLNTVDVSTPEGQGIAKANGVTETPTVIMPDGKKLEGDALSPAGTEAAMQAAGGNAAAPTPAAVKPTPTPAAPTPAPTVVIKNPTPTPPTKPTPTPTATPNVEKKTVVKQTETQTVVKQTVVRPTTTTTTTTQQPNIQVLQPQTQNQTTTKTTATQTVPEFSLLGLGAPALIIGAVYLVMRRK